MEVVTFRTGRVVYHGTSSPEEFTSLVGPVWVTTSYSVADWFKDWREDEYWDNPRILKFKTTRVLKLLEIQTKAEFAEMCEIIGAEDGYGPDELAEIFCQHFGDLDGWIIPENYPDGDDIMLCRPEDYLELDEILVN